MAKAVKKKPTEEKPEAKEPKLTDKQKLFCLEYAACLNATRAAIKAGYSADTAKEMGYENLTKPHLRAEVDLILSLRAMSAAEVIARIGQAARGQHADYWEYDAYGNPVINFRALYEDGMAHLVKEVEYNDFGRISKLKFADAQSALEKLGRHHKLFTDKVEHSGNLNERRADDLTDDELAIVIQSRKH